MQFTWNFIIDHVVICSDCVQDYNHVHTFVKNDQLTHFAGIGDLGRNCLEVFKYFRMCLCLGEFDSTFNLGDT